MVEREHNFIRLEFDVLELVLQDSVEIDLDRASDDSQHSVNIENLPVAVRQAYGPAKLPSFPIEPTGQGVEVGEQAFEDCVMHNPEVGSRLGDDFRFNAHLAIAGWSHEHF